MMDESIFKTYDIRGVYEKNLDEVIARKIARACSRIFKKGKVVIGYDARRSSPHLFKALSGELSKNSNINVIDIGMATTPLFYFSVNELSANGGIMVTASHNPREWNGFKIVGKHAKMIGGKEVGRVVKEEKNGEDVLWGSLECNKVEKRYDMLQKYADFLRARMTVTRPLRVVFDCGNGPVSIVLKKLFPVKRVQPYMMLDNIDGNFPGRSPNPLTPGALRPLIRKVLKTKADFGIAFDADGDRMFVVDGRGKIVPSYIVMMLLSQKSKGPFVGEVLMYQMLKSAGFKKEIYKTKVGTYFVKERMRKENATIAGEYSGHYYFRDFFFTDSGMLAAVNLMNVVSKLPYSISDFVNLSPNLIVKALNVRCRDNKKTIQAIKKTLRGDILSIDVTDGETFFFRDGWMNVRPSNTEPLLRFFVVTNSKNRSISLTRVVKSLKL